MANADPSDVACIERLRPKTVPEGLIALGTVFQVTEIQVKLQIVGGITCLVDRFNISQPYSQILEELSRSRGSSEPPSRLPQMFKRGEQYVCKIIRRETRKGYADAQDIIATLDPASIQEECLPKTLLAIPHAPIQGAVQSVEDHGYQVDIGFKGLTGFLSFDECEAYCKKNNDGQKFSVGQILRCCLKNTLDLEDGARVVQLGMSKDSMKMSEFSRDKVNQYMLTEKCILPGSKSFLTVMKVRKEGLVVNFMNEFAGFVDMNHLKDEWHTPKDHYKISDKLDCTVLYYNHITKMFALSIRDQSKFKKTLKHFLSNYHIGQVIRKAEVAYLNGTKSVSFKVDQCYKAVANVRDAIPDDVSTMTRDEIHTALDASYVDGTKHKCRIKSINLADLILVLSLRQEFLDLPYVSVEELKSADFVEATVKKYVKDGIVVSFGLNLRAIILNQDLHDYVSAKTYKKYPVGKVIKCRVLKVDFSKQPARVYLTNKQQLMDPNLHVVNSYEKSWKGKTTFVTITKIRQDGLIVELFNNVKGFVPRRFASTVPVKDLGSVFKIGRVTPCVIYRADPGRKTLMLGIVAYENIMKLKKEKKEAKKLKREKKKLEKIDNKLNRKIEALTESKKSLPDDKLTSSATKSEKSPKESAQKVVQKKQAKKREIDEVDWDSDDSVVKINPRESQDRKLSPHEKKKKASESLKSSKFLKTDSGINWSADFDTVRRNASGQGADKDDESGDDDVDTDSSSTSDGSGAGENSDAENNVESQIKSRRQRSDEAKSREERLREAEREMMDPDRQPQTMMDFERLVLKTPNSADVWTRYSKFFLDNVETEKARIVCRRALKTINFRMEKEKLKVWLHLIKIEAKYGGSDKLRETIDEAAQTSDKLRLYSGTVKVLSSCGESAEAERMCELMLKLDSRSADVWTDYIQFCMEHRKDLARARELYDRASKSLLKSDLVALKSRFAQLEFRLGDVERGKTMFENLLSDNPRRTDLWRVYEGMIRKFGTRQLDNDEIREQNRQTLERIAESIALVSKKAKRKSD